MEIKVKSISIEQDNEDSLYSVFIEYEGSYITFARNEGEEDKHIYIEKDNQSYAIYILPCNIKYIIQNKKIEFFIDKEVELEIEFERHFIIDFFPIDFKQYQDIEKTLMHIWGKNNNCDVTHGLQVRASRRNGEMD
jgi:hypothetical protein